MYSRGFIPRVRSSDSNRRSRSETTDGNTRNFVRSRTMIEISRTEGLGYIQCLNLEKIFTTE
jgi:hypothetical protein